MSAIARTIVARRRSLGTCRFGNQSCAVVARQLSTTCNPINFAKHLDAPDRANRRAISLAHPTICVWGANTDVGKTLVSAGLAQALSQTARVGPTLNIQLNGANTVAPGSSNFRHQKIIVFLQGHVLFLKPVQTGFPADCDSRLVASALGIAPTYGQHAQHAQQAVASGAGSISRASSSAPGLRDSSAQRAAAAQAHTVFAWRQPVSPHIAAATEGRGVSDASVHAAVVHELHRFQSSVPQGQAACALVETAGGVASPGPSGSLQCDILRPARLPALLVGDGRLGGISTTIAAFELLRSRGYDVPAIALMEKMGGNCEALRQQLGPSTPVIQLPQCAPADDLPRSPGGLDAQLLEWLDGSRKQFDALAVHLQQWHEARLARLQEAAAAARRDLWWPFTQHASVTNDSEVMVIDSRCGEDFAAFAPGSSESSCITSGSAPAIEQRFDACASWWTQGTSAELHPRIIAAVSHAAGRYGHVMFPENAHQPALDVASKLLSTVGKGWASRVFFSDDGSTAVEVALKMAFRRFAVDNALDDAATAKLRVLGLDNAYHGDTLGAMSAVPASVFNGPRQFPWYEGRGLFLEPPSVGLSRGTWNVRLPAALEGKLDMADLQFPSRDAIFDASRDETAVAAAYRSWIAQQLDSQEGRLGAALLEPVLQGAGGMLLVDPLFQRQLVGECRSRNIPVIFDEVFSGLWRLGAVSAAQLLGATPDVACYAKLLTGGLLPLAVTLASDTVFKAFEGPEKADALLHGHSYTAHPLGCAAAVAALELFENPALNPRQRRIPQGGSGGAASDSSSAAEAGSCQRLTEFWDPELLLQLSHHPAVERCHALGTVLAAEVKAADGSRGYSSGAAKAVVKRLAPHGIYARPLGNIVYLMVTPTTAQERCDRLLRQLLEAL